MFGLATARPFPGLKLLPEKLLFPLGVPLEGAEGKDEAKDKLFLGDPCCEAGNEKPNEGGEGEPLPGLGPSELLLVIGIIRAKLGGTSKGAGRAIILGDSNTTAMLCSNG